MLREPRGRVVVRSSYRGDILTLMKAAGTVIGVLLAVCSVLALRAANAPSSAALVGSLAWFSIVLVTVANLAERRFLRKKPLRRETLLALTAGFLLALALASAVTGFSEDDIVITLLLAAGAILAAWRIWTARESYIQGGSLRWRRA